MAPWTLSLPHRSRRSWIWTASAIGAAVVVIHVLFASAIPLSSDTLRRKVIATLSDRLDADVQLDGVSLRVFPRFHAEGTGLVIRQKGRVNAPPLISVKSLTIDADLVGLLRKHVARVGLDGLDIEILPGDKDDPGAAPADNPHPAYADASDMVIDSLVSANAKLVIVPRESRKAPKVWAIHDLHMRSVSFGRSMPFDAVLTNAIPPGEITAKGIFGPWQPDEPGDTRLEGTFVFDRADLGIFKGISGILSAHGEFGGALGRISVHGETTTPEFTLDFSGHPVSLHTDYHATVDGTNGDTYLDLINASFLKTSLVAKGSVVDSPDKSGRTVTLDVTIDRGRVEDVLTLASKSDKPPMVGDLKMTTKMVLPPGHRDVVEKLRLDGRFSIAQARFTEVDVQKKINEMSEKSRGTPEAVPAQNVASNFNGRFTLADTVLHLRELDFAMPGAHVRLAGDYHLRGETLDFKGMLYMRAKISETQSGLKRLLLKVIDPLFAGDKGGSAIPIKVEGKRSDPDFGLDKGRVFHRH